MLRFCLALATAGSLIFCANSAMAESLTPEQQATVDKYRAILKGLHPHYGDVGVPTSDATLHLGKDYYFLDASEAKQVLTEGWGNPANAVDDVLGMVFPAGKTFVDDAWGAVVTYHQTGYVTDDDAKSADYSKIIADFQSGEDKLNGEREKQGFPVQHLVGWAQQPSYNALTHSVIWARDIKFGDQTDDTLNYDVRLLGRRGVLSLNMISAMSKLPEIKQAAENFGQAASFNPGARYADYDSSIDKKAGYGIAGLVAAGVGVVAAKKLGLLAILALAGKKIAVVIAAIFAAILGKFKSLFRRKSAD
jgi:uncharacterized membrane-anchored protein